MPKKYKISPEKRKSLGITSGINASTVSQLKKISKIKKPKVELPQVPLCDLYMRVDGAWVHKGKSCQLCKLLINNPIVIDKHRYVCKVLNNKDSEEH